MNEQLLVAFIKRENENKRKGKRRYLHFDDRLNLDKGIISYVTKPQNIVRHSFYPFLRFIQRKKKYKRTDHKITVAYKDREICYASHIDSFIYSWYCTILNEAYEKIIQNSEVSNSILAYRRVEIDNNPGNNIYFAKEVFDLIKKRGECCVITLDIKGFFDNLDHNILKKAWESILGLERLPDDHFKVFGSLTKFAIVDVRDVFKEFGIKKYNKESYNLLRRISNAKDFRDKIRKLIKLNPNKFAIPQGSGLSALLSNIYLLEFDKFVVELLIDKDGVYRRYCDDIIIICNLKHKNEVINKVSSKIEEFKLTINPDKTETILFKKDGAKLIIDKNESNRHLLQYLGFEFDGEDSTIRSSSLARYYRKMKTGVRRAFEAKIKNQQGPIVYKKKLYEKHSHLGKQNFLSYGKRAIKITNSPKIKKQIKSHWSNLQNEIQKHEKSI